MKGFKKMGNDAEPFSFRDWMWGQLESRGMTRTEFAAKLGVAPWRLDRYFRNCGVAAFYPGDPERMVAALPGLTVTEFLAANERAQRDASRLPGLPTYLMSLFAPRRDTAPSPLPYTMTCLLVGLLFAGVLGVMSLHVFFNRTADQFGSAKAERQPDLLQALQERLGNPDVDLNFLHTRGFLRHDEHDGGSYHPYAKRVAVKRHLEPFIKPMLHSASFCYQLSGVSPLRPEVDGVEAEVIECPTDRAERCVMASNRPKQERPTGGKWPLWLVVTAEGKPAQYLVTRADANGLPEPVAVVSWLGHDAVRLANAIACNNELAGRKVKRPGKYPAGIEWAGVSDWRGESMGRWADVVGRCTLIPLDNSGAVATFDGDSFGAKIVRGKDARMEWQDARTGVRFCLGDQNKNGTSELTTHTLKLAGTGRGRVATPTAA